MISEKEIEEMFERLSDDDLFHYFLILGSHFFSFVDVYIPKQKEEGDNAPVEGMIFATTEENIKKITGV